MVRKKKRVKENLSIRSSRGYKLVAVSDTKSIISEQFRTIRTNLMFALPDQELKTILITSSTPGEGKSTNASNIAVAFSQEGKRVLIIDADMRKPSQHYIFRVYNTLGLSTVLSKKSVLTESIQETPIIGLSILPSGPIPPNPAELLSSHAMDAALEEMRKAYDIVIFDAPPLLSISDAQILSNKCDGTLLIINSGAVERDAVIKAKAVLLTSKARILGVVLNNYKMSRSLQNYYQYYEEH